MKVANLLPWSIRNGERCVQVATRALPEMELPRAQALSDLRHSSIEVILLKDLRRAAARRKQTGLVKDLLEMIPSASQRRIFMAVHKRFLRCFSQGRIEIGHRSWNLAGDPLKVYCLYAAVREALDAIVAPQLRFGSTHVVTLALPLPVRRFRPIGELVRTGGEHALHIQFPLDGSRIDVDRSADNEAAAGGNMHEDAARRNHHGLKLCSSFPPIRWQSRLNKLEI